ncbi:ornithine carbamoyltransferase [endosymbiont of unidentified scaly snail isolate Monju]|uniref:ornithine carbamoyltransferase n=1 Tax=endosymbiont of unidentified scaly snail isolate Monju TaxID=1248727 RepID=UPI00038929A9|nr:ornithine carbamoyltransferase [endosymbiont of unidentified scaly snail isolate Monju]BAN68470.1 ornithine carbamoyltransferase [endosymbiont of unidentified scaly snail isolate Monju]
MSRIRHFLTLLDLSPEELRGIIQRASELKRLQRAGEPHATLQGKVLAMIFEKSSTRTRVSFETGMSQLGGSAMFLSPRDTQLGRGEPIEDTARVLSRMVDCVMIRTFAHDNVERFAEHSQVPVINGLTDLYHPCQLLADMQTFFEHRGDIRGRTVAWVGDGNNMCHSYINAARQFDFQLRVACPEGYEPDADILAAAGERAQIVRDPTAAIEGADLVVTDTWVSMGQEEEKQHRQTAFAPYKVTRELMALATPDALFMHCLPAYRGMEVEAEVLDAPDSVVWDEAENRLHAQKALLEFLLAG